MKILIALTLIYYDILLCRVKLRIKSRSPSMHLILTLLLIHCLSLLLIMQLEGYLQKVKKDTKKEDKLGKVIEMVGSVLAGLA